LDSLETVWSVSFSVVVHSTFPGDFLCTQGSEFNKESVGEEGNRERAWREHTLRSWKEVL
jgi:hypothetical protein